MSLQEVPYKVENLTTGIPVNITNFVSSIDSLKFEGTGKIRTASIMLNATEGAFITNPDIGGVGQTAIINEFDKFKIEFEDDLQRKKSIIVEVDQELGQKNQSGVLLPLEFKGREAALQRNKFTAFFQFKTPLFVFEELRRRYNRDKGADEPTLRFNKFLGTIDTVLAPNNIVNIYDFTQEISFYDAFMQIITRLNQPVGQGGTGNFFSLTFEDGETVDGFADSIIMNVFVQGSTPASPPTIESLQDDPIHSIDYAIQSQSGTQIFVRGQVNTGYMPVEFHRFQSFREEISSYPAYEAAETYAIGIRVRGGDNEVYEANSAVPINTAPPNVSFWDLKTPFTIIGALQYSPWTNNKVAVTKNSGANPGGTFLIGDFDAPAMMDGNMVIKEGFNSTTGEFLFFRDFVWMRVKDDGDIQSDPVLRHYLIQQIGAGLYNGFRVLVDSSLGPLGGSFVQNGGFDKFGRPFADSMVIRNDNNEWIVFREPQVGDQAVVITEGRTYEFNGPFSAVTKFGAAHKAGKLRGSPGPLEWRDISFTAGGNDVFHHPQNIEQVDGLFPKDINGDNYIPFVTGSALKITFRYNITDELTKFFGKFGQIFSDPFNSLVDLADTIGIDGFDDFFEPNPAAITQTQLSSYYDSGWWYTIAWPYPFSTLNGITEDIGDLYGKATPGLTGTQREFAVLDLQNGNFSHSGKTGLNHDEISDLGGPFTGVHFYFNFNIFFDFAGGDVQKPFTGDIDFTVTLYDDLSQVWRTDFTYRHLGDTQEIFIPFSSFTVDRPSRTPWGINTLLSNIVVPELEIRSIFEQKRVRFMTIQFNDAYDDEGRFLPVNLTNLVTQLFVSATVRFEGIIDGLCLTKQPFVSSGVELDRVINPETFQQPNTRNLRQLESIAIALRDIHGLQFEQYTVSQDGKCDLTTEQAVILKDVDVIKFADVGPNTRKLIVMSEDLSFNANGQKSGFIRTTKLTRRLNPP